MATQKLLSISVTTRQWSYGNYAWFDARLKSGTTIEVLWGDGESSVLTALQTELSRVEHLYKKLDSDDTYLIEFWSETAEALIELRDGLLEMTLNRIIFHLCPDLQKMSIRHLPETDFSECPALKELDAYNCYCKVLDLHTAPELRKLFCGGSGHLETLILTGNDKLEELECQVNPRLSKISLSNKSSLRKIQSYMTGIDDKSMDYISRILKKNNPPETIKMYRVVALGYRAAEIVDRLRATKEYDDIKFVYCNTDKDMLEGCGREEDEHIHLKNMAQCREAIHDDNELMAVLVTCLGYDWGPSDTSREYAAEIMSELWDYADHTYCFATIPFAPGGHRPSAFEIFDSLTYWSDISVLQDDLKEPYKLDVISMDEGLVRFLDLVLSHPRKGRSSELDELPFGVWATEKQVLTAMNAMYTNNMPKYYKADTFSFHKSTHEY